MRIEAGAHLGSFEILGSLGAGGMGEVYRARDLKLGREVAIKVLKQPDESSADVLGRFKREAQLLASLSHPHIATLYGAEESTGIRYLVLELVPGETLAAQLAQGPTSLKEGLRIAAQIASALEAAHKQGIIHRDLKPSNIKLTSDGQVKVLDFGLAKMLDPESKDSGVARSMTETSSGTREGTLLGTPAYMSPEQARGKVVGEQTDVWSFGCVLYELLTGHAAFARETLSDTIAAILGSDPSWQALPHETPPSIRRLLRRTLEKDPHHRLRDIGDALLEIDETLNRPASAVEGIEWPQSTEGWVHRAAWLAGSVALGIVVGASAVWFLKTTKVVPRPIAQFVVPVLTPARLTGLDFPAVAISPTGEHLVYVASRGGSSQLFIRPLGTLESSPIPGTERALNPFFAPDGQWLGFFADGQLKKVSVTGGPTVILSSAPVGFGGTWGRDNTIIFAPSSGSALWQVSGAGGTAKVLTRLDTAKGEFSHRWPELLPGSKAVLFTSGTLGSWDDAEIVAQSLETNERQVLIRGGSHPRYVETGHLVYARAGTLMAVPFDSERLRITGSPVAIVPNVMQSFDGAAQFGVSANGTLVYAPGAAREAARTLVWVDRRGGLQRLAAPSRAYSFPRLSPDGDAVAVTIEQDKQDVWVYNISQDTLRQLTFEGSNSAPVWTRDGGRIVFSSTRAGPVNLFWRRADGSGMDERLTTGQRPQVADSWSPDARVLTFVEHHPQTGRDVWIFSPDSDPRLSPLLASQANEATAVFSADGHWLAYVSDESGRYEVYVRSFPAADVKLKVSTDGGTEPSWARDGRELFYRAGTRMMTVSVSTGRTRTTQRPTVLFDGIFEKGTASRPNFDVSPDGLRFLMVKTAEHESVPSQLHVMLEWSQELARRARPQK